MSFGVGGHTKRTKHYYNEVIESTVEKLTLRACSTLFLADRSSSSDSDSESELKDDSEISAAAGPIKEGPGELAVRGGDPTSEGIELKGEAELNGSEGFCEA